MTTSTQEIDGNIIDVRDAIARYQYLEHEIEAGTADEDETEEFEPLKALLEELAGSGGDEEWRGTWYPMTLIADSYFEEYARELADDLGLINREASWPYTCIDWEKAARELQMDYTTIEFDGSTYWYR